MSRMAGRRHLVIFVKAPQRGAVKTRLARAIGSAAAQAFYRRLAAATIARLGGDRRWQSWLAVAPDGFARRGRFWPPALPRRAQGPGPLFFRAQLEAAPSLLYIGLKGRPLLFESVFAQSLNFAHFLNSPVEPLNNII